MAEKKKTQNRRKKPTAPRAGFIADGVGVDLRSEEPAYLSGDAAMALAKTICELGCEHCNG